MYVAIETTALATGIAGITLGFTIGFLIGIIFNELARITGW